MNVLSKIKALAINKFNAQFPTHPIADKDVVMKAIAPNVDFFMAFQIDHKTDTTFVPLRLYLNFNRIDRLSRFRTEVGKGFGDLSDEAYVAVGDIAGEIGDIVVPIYVKPVVDPVTPSVVIAPKLKVSTPQYDEGGNNSGYYLNYFDIRSAPVDPNQVKTTISKVFQIGETIELSGIMPMTVSDYVVSERYGKATMSMEIEAGGRLQNDAAYPDGHYRGMAMRDRGFKVTGEISNEIPADDYTIDLTYGLYPEGIVSMDWMFKAKDSVPTSTGWGGVNIVSWTPTNAEWANPQDEKFRKLSAVTSIDRGVAIHLAASKSTSWFISARYRYANGGVSAWSEPVETSVSSQYIYPDSTVMVTSVSSNWFAGERTNLEMAAVNYSTMGSGGQYVTQETRNKLDLFATNGPGGGQPTSHIYVQVPGMTMGYEVEIILPPGTHAFKVEDAANMAASWIRSLDFGANNSVEETQKALSFYQSFNSSYGVNRGWWSQWYIAGLGSDDIKLLGAALPLTYNANGIPFSSSDDGMAKIGKIDTNFEGMTTTIFDVSTAVLTITEDTIGTYTLRDPIRLISNNNYGNGHLPATLKYTDDNNGVVYASFTNEGITDLGNGMLEIAGYYENYDAGVKVRFTISVAGEKDVHALVPGGYKYWSFTGKLTNKTKLLVADYVATGVFYPVGKKFDLGDGTIVDMYADVYQPLGLTEADLTEDMALGVGMLTLTHWGNLYSVQPTGPMNPGVYRDVGKLTDRIVVPLRYLDFDGVNLTRGGMPNRVKLTIDNPNTSYSRLDFTTYSLYNDRSIYGIDWIAIPFNYAANNGIVLSDDMMNGKFIHGRSCGVYVQLDQLATFLANNPASVLAKDRMDLSLLENIQTLSPRFYGNDYTIDEENRAATHVHSPAHLLPVDTEVVGSASGWLIGAVARNPNVDTDIYSYHFIFWNYNPNAND